MIKTKQKRGDGNVSVFQSKNRRDMIWTIVDQKHRKNDHRFFLKKSSLISWNSIPRLDHGIQGIVKLLKWKMNIQRAEETRHFTSWQVRVTRVRIGPSAMVRFGVMVTVRIQDEMKKCLVEKFSWGNKLPNQHSL